MSWSALAARALLLATAGAALGAGINAVRPDGVRASHFAPPVSCAVTAAPVVRVGPRQAAAMCGDPGVVIADARVAARFAEGHIAGALHLPCSASGVAASDALSHLNGKHTVIVYGDSTEEALAVAESLRQPGTVKVAVLDGGFAAWSGAGLACSSGPCTDCAVESRAP